MTKSSKRPRSEEIKTDFLIQYDYQGAKDFYQKCKLGQNYETRIWDQDTYIANHPHPRETQEKLQKNPIELREVLYFDPLRDEYVPTGK